jgi:hypothetical protein
LILQKLILYLQATKLKNSGTRIFTVGVTDAVDNNLLQSVATQPSYNFFVAEFSQLMNQIDAIINSVSYLTHAIIEVLILPIILLLLYILGMYNYNIN